MASITSTGLGSGLDIKSIVSQLVELEKRPLTPLKSQAAIYQNSLSVYGTIKSQVAALGDAAAKLSKTDGWNAVTASSSNKDAVGVTAAAGAAPTSLTLEVQQLARAQSTASSAIATGASVGTGTMSIQIGTWSGNSFTAGTGSPVEISIGAGEDSLTAIAAKINQAGAGVSATVLRDASGERLLMRSTDTGEEKAFRIQVTESADAPGLSRLAYDPANAGSGMTLSQSAQNAMATVNNVAITSASNTLADNLPGLTLQLSQVTTAPVEIQVNVDKDAIKKNIQNFITAYNTLNTTLTTATRYDPETKEAGPLQGDSTAVGLQNALRSMMRSVTASSPFTRLVDVGIEAKTGGTLELKSDKLDAALATNIDGLKSLFTITTGNSTTQGFGLKIKAFADGLLSADGLVTNKTTSLQGAITRNGKEQDKVTERAARAETRLLAQYNAMDTAVGQLSSLNAFVTQQITLWNKNTSN